MKGKDQAKGLEVNGNIVPRRIFDVRGVVFNLVNTYTLG
jgi:hypothetical protein